MQGQLLHALLNSQGAAVFCFIVSSVGFANCDAMALMGQSNVLLTAQPKNRNFPHTCWMNFLPFLSSGGEMDS